MQLAEQNLHDTGTNLDKSFLAYEQGSIVLEFMAHDSDVNPQQVHNFVRTTRLKFGQKLT